jgi:hypothetical protein
MLVSRSAELFTVAYAVGYYYGRSSGPAQPEIAEADSPYAETLAFRSGVEAGKRDFQEIDLILLAAKAGVLPVDTQM